MEAEETSYGGIIVPDLGNEKNKLGKVIAVGDGYYSVTGHYIETILNVWRHYYSSYYGPLVKLEHEGE
jgi:co-chaperonin GroES (HSP10)